MAYDGIFIKAQLEEINKSVLNEHISKITQKSQKEIDFHIRKNNKNLILSLSSNPNFPYILLSENIIENTNVPPSFCMLLRKYLQGAKIIKISQIGKDYGNSVDKNNFLERIVCFEFENIDENGDISTYYIYFEIMGKYSNIIITDSKNTIIDVLIKSSIMNKRLNPKTKYSIDEIENKNEILFEENISFIENINNAITLSKINEQTFDLSNYISSKYAGISKSFVIHEMIKYLQNKKSNPILNDKNTNNLNYEFLNSPISNNESFEELFKIIKNDITEIIDKSFDFTPVINYKNDKPSDFYLFKLNTYEGQVKTFDTINNCLENFINEKYIDINDSSEKKNIETIIKNLYIKLNKKIDIYKKDFAKCENIEHIKNYAELISVYGYDTNNIKNGILTCKDYNNDNNIVNIPIDESISIAKNVEKYYDRYNKLKRTKVNAESLMEETLAKIEHLNTISNQLSIKLDKNDLYLVKEELIKYFDETNKFISLKKQKNDINKRKNVAKNKLNYNIHHFKSSDGIDIYVGKNNLQNEYLTFTLASPNDTWLHIKDATGSHVIIKKPYENLSDKTLIEAASLAAYYSEKKNETKATVDYTLRKELKKVKGKAPGFCIYHKNYSINVKPEITIKEIK